MAALSPQRLRTRNSTAAAEPSAFADDGAAASLDPARDDAGRFESLRRPSRSSRSAQSGGGIRSAGSGETFPNESGSAVRRGGAALPRSTPPIGRRSLQGCTPRVATCGSPGSRSLSNFPTGSLLLCPTL